MDAETLRIIGEIAGIALGALASARIVNRRTLGIIRVFVDTINKVGDVIGQENQKKVKKAIRNESMKHGMHEKVDKAVKKAESQNAQ